MGPHKIHGAAQHMTTDMQGAEKQITMQKYWLIGTGAGRSQKMPRDTELFVKYPQDNKDTEAIQEFDLVK